MKKRFSMLVALVMLVTTLIPSFTVNAAFDDVADNNPYKEAITTLSTLKVINGYDDGTFQPDKEISRAEFTKMVVYMLGLDNLTTTITSFNDVSLDHWANANIRTAYDLGIINGFDEVTFKPDAPVTYEQALKMLVCTLGYQNFAEQQGGYPQGYINQAGNLKLTDKVTGLGYSDNAPRGAIAQMMYNALEVEKYELINNSWKASGKTLLNDYLNVQSLKGIVVGVEDSTTTACDSVLSKGQMAVDDSVTGTEYVIDFSDYGATLAEMTANLGRTVQIYYRTDRTSDDKWLVEMSSDMYKNEEITINSNQIEGFEGNAFKYYEDGAAKTTTLRVNLDELAVRYNGRAVEDDVVLGDSDYTLTEALGEWFDPDSEYFINGTAKFINNTTASAYNVIDIYDYETIVAQSPPSTADYRIMDKTVSGRSLILDPESLTYTFTITKNGSEIEPTQISANDVINYAMSLDGDFYTVLVTSKSVSGKITATNLSASPKTITIGETKYAVTDRFMTYMATKEQREVAAGLQITAYLDAFGALEWGTISSSSKYYPYAYVIDYDSEGEDYYLKLFAPTNTSITSLTSSTPYKVKTYKIASGSKLNGRKKSGEAIVSALAETQDETDAEITDATYTGYNQFIRVSFNSSGEIENVVTCSDEGTTNTDTALLVKYNALSDSPYDVTKNSVKTDDGTYAIRTTTPLFVIPADRTDLDGYMLKPAVTNSTMTDGGEYYVESFDVNTSMLATCLAVYGNVGMQSGTPITYSTKHSLVAEDIYQEVDSLTGEVVDVLKSYNSSTALSSIYISDDPEDDFSDVEMGDIILYGTDSDGYADKYELSLAYSDILSVLEGAADAEDEDTIYDWTDSDFSTRYPSSSNRTLACMYNVVRVADGNTLHVTREGFTKGTGEAVSADFDTISVGNATIVRYDSETEEFTPYVYGTESTALTINDLLEADSVGSNCSKIAVLSYYLVSSDTQTVNMIVIYE